MVWRTAFTGVLFLALAFPAGTAQSADGGWVVLFDDPRDDTYALVTPTDGRAPTALELGPGAQAVDGPDLRTIEARDNETDLILRATFHPPDNPLNLQRAIGVLVDLTIGQAPYRIDNAGGYGGFLYSIDALGELHTVTQLAGAHVDDQTWDVFVPREHLLDETGAPPERGSLVLALAADAYGGLARFAQHEFTFHDGAVGPIDYTFATGLTQTGPGRLVLPVRSAASNGESTAHAYPFEVRNTDTVPHTFELIVSDLPSDSWIPSFVRREIQLEGEGSLRDTLVVTVPFAHQHGEREQFFLSLRQLDGPGEAKAGLSVFYFTIPQPTGHHDTLWIHARENMGTPDLSAVLGDSHELYMNTLAEDPDGAAVPVSAGSFQAPREDYHWRIPMSPELGLPLSFDAAQPARLRAAFSSSAPQLNAQVSAVLSIDGMDVPVVDFPPVSVDLQGGEATVDLAGQVKLAFVEAVRGQNLVLDIFLTSDNMPVSSFGVQLPSLLPGAELTLPLLEYRASTGAAESLDLRLGLGERSLRVAAGSSATFEGTIENRAAGPATVAFAVEGVNSTWFGSAPELRLDPGQSLTFSLPIQVPREAREGDIADVIVRVTRDGGSGVSERLLVVVSGEGESGPAGEASADAPGVPVGLMLAAVAAALLARRRR